MPSSSSSNAFARRVSRVSAFPSRTSAIRSARMLGSRKSPRIMPQTRIACRDNGKPFFAYLRNRGIVRHEHPNIFVLNRQSYETYRFTVGDDGTLPHDEPQSDLGEARRTAIAF